MRITYSYHFLLLSFFTLLLTACAEGRKAEGLAVTLRGAEVPFSGESVMATIAGEPYRYFRYPDIGSALKDKSTVSADGRTIGGKNFVWEGPVHFYHYKDRLVIYVGDTEEVITHIRRTFGPQFAGSE